LLDQDTKLVDAPPGGFSAHFHHLLAAPALLAFRPLLFDSRLQDAEACEIDDSVEPTYEGRTCRVVRVTGTTTPNPAAAHSVPTEHIYWVDPTRDCVVVRCMIMWDNTLVSQLDIHHQQRDDVGWVPSRWSVVRFGPSTHVVRQVATAVLEDIEIHDAPDKGKSGFQVPPGTWVVDTVASRQYVVGEDFSARNVKGDYPFPAHTYGNPVSRSQERPALDARRIRRVLLGLIQWPGVLIPIIVISGILVVTKGMAGRRKSLSQSKAAAKRQEDSGSYT